MPKSSHIRIIAGDARGRKVAVPTGIADLRPTRDRVRESLFNILGAQIEGARFLDLYAGTGANGIEALSRGAAHCTFVDSDRRATDSIGEHLDRFGYANRGTVIRASIPDAFRLVNGPFDLIFADPPYADRAVDTVQEGLRERYLLDEDGVLVVETDSKSSGDESSEIWPPYRTERYGQTTLRFYRH